MGRIYDKLTKEQRTAFNYALTYPENETRINALRDNRRAIRYDTDKVQTSPDDPMFSLMVQLTRLTTRNANIDDALLEVFGKYGNTALQMAKEMLCYGRKMAEVEAKHGRLPIGHNEYYRKRREFWTVLSERI